MKQLTKEELKKCIGFHNSLDEPLSNGQNGYCKEEKTLVICCANCGDYIRIANVVIKKQ